MHLGLESSAAATGLSSAERRRIDGRSRLRVNSGIGHREIASEREAQAYRYAPLLMNVGRGPGQVGRVELGTWHYDHRQ